jgi:hypothetical protein
VDKAVPDPLKERLQSAFPAGTFAWVKVLEYGDDPAVEPGDTAIRAFVANPGRPDDNWDSRQTLADWADANSEGIEELHRGLLPSVAWVDFVPDTPERRAEPYDQGFGSTRFLGKRPDVMDGTPDGAPLRTWLTPADLATVDTLITAGACTSRADAVRWALRRLREDPAYSRLRQRAGNEDPTAPLPQLRA